MTLNELRYIVAVARERHFGRAAEACYVSQPTLSVAVKKLEEELGVSLFERGQGEVSVTPVGERIVGQAQRVLEEAAGIRQLALQGQDQLAGPLRLGAIYTIAPYLMPHLVPELSRRAPQMPLIIEETFTAHLTELLKQGDLDVVIISLPFDEPGILTLPLYDEPFVAMMPAGHPLASRRNLSGADLAEENVLLLGAGHCFRDQVLEFCPECMAAGRRREGNLSAHSVEGSSLETIRYMVASGLGMTVLPCTATRMSDPKEEDMVVFKRFAGTPPSRRVALAWRKSFPRPEVVDVLREAVLACRMRCTRAV